MPMKLMLVGDRSLFMEGLQNVLKSHGILVVGTAKDYTDAVEKALVLKPDIILMDVKILECGGLDALKVLKTEMPDINVVALTSSEEEYCLLSAIKLGNYNAQELVEMLFDIEESGDISKECLTERQLEVLQMVARGSTYKNVAVALGLTERTVKYHIARIIEKLQLENKSQLIAYATRMGFLKDN